MSEVACFVRRYRMINLGHRLLFSRRHTQVQRRNFGSIGNRRIDRQVQEVIESLVIRSEVAAAGLV